MGYSNEDKEAIWRWLDDVSRMCQSHPDTCKDCYVFTRESGTPRCNLNPINLDYRRKWVDDVEHWAEKHPEKIK